MVILPCTNESCPIIISIYTKHFLVYESMDQTKEGFVRRKDSCLCFNNCVPSFFFVILFTVCSSSQNNQIEFSFKIFRCCIPQ